MLIHELQQKIVESFQPIPLLSPDPDWGFTTSSLKQSIFFSLPSVSVTPDASSVVFSKRFMEDLRLARFLPNKRYKHDVFDMMVRKYGFLHFQAAGLERGSFLELELEIVFEEGVNFDQAIRNLKTMWKQHMWDFLKDYKKNKTVRRISLETLSNLLPTLEFKGEGFWFRRKVIGVLGELVEEVDPEKVIDALKEPGEKIQVVRVCHDLAGINRDQFVFSFRRTKRGETAANADSRNSKQGTVF